MINSQLQAFEAIVEEKTVHAAAAAIYLTQTAVTQRIKSLEQKLHTTLFIRSRRGMELTQEGEVLHRYCQQIEELQGQLLASLHGAGVTSSVRVRIAAPTCIMRSRVIPSCERVLKTFPELLISFIVDDTLHIYQRLKSGDAEFVILSPEQLFDEVQSKFLRSENYVLVCSAQWKNRSLNDIIESEKIIDFDDEDPITFSYLKKHNLFESAKKERHYVNNTESLAYLLTAGIGYSVLTEDFAKVYLEREELILLNNEKVYEHQIALAWYPRLKSPKYFQSIVDAIN